jgi:hypothetical protein
MSSRSRSYSNWGEKLLLERVRDEFVGIESLIPFVQVFETDGAFGYLLHHQHRSELLGDGGDAEFYVGSVGDVPFAVGETVPLLEDDLVMVRDKDVKEQHSAYWVMSLAILSAVPMVSAAM